MPLTVNRRWIIAVVLTLVVAAVAWQARWGIGGAAVEIVDPIVRRWARGEVERLSNGFYRLESSPIRVDASRRMVSVDTIRLITARERNSSDSSSLPDIDFTFIDCSLEGVNLERMANRGGVHASRGGCSDVVLIASVPRGIERDTTSGDFLTLRRDVQLGEGVPSVNIDSVVFPAVRLSLKVAGRTGRSTMLDLERLSMVLDSLSYDPDVPVEQRRTLLSRNVTLALDSLVGSRESADRLSINRIRADLASGTLQVSGLAWDPLTGAFADSLGLREIAIDSLGLTGVDWGAFLTRGDAVAHSFVINGVRIDVASGTGPATLSPEGHWTLGGSLRSIDRAVALDSFVARQVRVRQLGQEESVSEASMLTLSGLRFGFDTAAWALPDPIGPVTIAATAPRHRWQDYEVAANQLLLDLSNGTSQVTALRYSTVGTDADFRRRRRYRTDRIGLTIDRGAVRGLESSRWIRSGSYRARKVDLAGFQMDIFSDKRMPANPAGASHRHPQAWFAALDTDLHVDTIAIQGWLNYRERGPNATAAGSMRFDSLSARLVNFGIDPGNGDNRLLFSGRALLMGAAPLVLELEMPLRSPGFEMQWHGSLGEMQVTELNDFLLHSTDVQLTEGTVDRITYRVETHDGYSRGVIEPRYRDLYVELPGMARTGILQGIRRSLAKFAANQFVIREDNYAGMDSAAVNGQVARRWDPAETLIQHLWFSLRDGLVQVVKR